MGVAARRHGMDMTTGPIFQKMLVFALPLVLTNILQMLYNVADMIVVGRFSMADGAVGAIGCTGSFITLMNNFIFGLAAGATVIVSQAIGAGDRAATRRGVHTALMMGVYIGFACLLLGQLICTPMLNLLNTPSEYMEMAVKYCRICFIGLPFVAILNCALGVMRAQGDSTRPLVILSLSGVLNVAFNLVFVLVLKMDVDGVALATMLANVISAAAAMVCLAREDGDCRFNIKELRVDPATMRRVLAVGVPSGVQGMLFNISNMIIQSGVNSLGLVVVTASSIEISLHSFIYTAGSAVATAAMTVAGQNYGARNYRRILPSLYNGYFIVLLIGGALVAVTYTFLDPLAALYMNEATSHRAEIVDMVREVAFFRMLFMPLAGLMDTGAMALRGLGRSTTSMMISLICACVLRIAWIYTVFVLVREPWALFISYPITWVLGGVVQFIGVWTVTKKLIRAAEQTPAVQATT